eukprot:scaffold722_cov255-Prasinococcus_capsulatus_cf.AAC.9
MYNCATAALGRALEDSLGNALTFPSAQGLTDRGLGKNLETRKNYTQFAVVRNPLFHLLDAYKQTGFYHPIVVNGEPRKLSGGNASAMYCEASLEEKYEHFRQFLQDMGLTTVADTTPELQVPKENLVHRDPHRVNQLHWFQSYYSPRHGNVNVVEYVMQPPLDVAR